MLTRAGLGCFSQGTGPARWRIACLFSFLPALSPSTTEVQVLVCVPMLLVYPLTIGHLVGDVVLKQLSNAMTSKLRFTDVSGRYGGDEFCLILPSTTLTQGERFWSACAERAASISILIYRIFSSASVSVSPQIASIKPMRMYGCMRLTWPFTLPKLGDAI